jgi:hypothetical protein
VAYTPCPPLIELPFADSDRLNQEKIMNKPVGLLLATIFLSSPALAAKDEDKPKGCPERIASTIFVADKTGSRQGGSAKKISETHRTAQAQGWTFDEMQIYIEDGDLQGFFITYTKVAPCRAQ